MTDRFWVILAALLAMLAVSAGAFGAHALADQVSPERIETFRLAARYQLLHALALLVVVALGDRLDRTWRLRAQAAFCGGILLFSGSLYLLVLTDTPKWGAVTPIGGILFHAGWLAVAWAAYRRERGNL